MAFKIYYDNNHVLTKNKNSFTLFEEWNEHENNEYKEIKQKTKKNNEINNEKLSVIKKHRFSWIYP